MITIANDKKAIAKNLEIPSPILSGLMIGIIMWAE